MTVVTQLPPLKYSKRIEVGVNRSHFPSDISKGHWQRYGGLGADLENERTLEKKWQHERVCEFSKRLREINLDRIKKTNPLSNSTFIPQLVVGDAVINAKKSREKILAFSASIRKRLFNKEKPPSSLSPIPHKPLTCPPIPSLDAIIAKLRRHDQDREILSRCYSESR